MRSAIEYYYPKTFTEEFFDVVNGIGQIVYELPDKPNDDLWSCHAVTRALKDYFSLPWIVKDGFFHKRGTCHSWFQMKSIDNESTLVIDVLPMGAQSKFPIISDGQSYSPWGGLYLDCEAGYYDKQRAQFEQDAEVLKSIMHTYYRYSPDSFTLSQWFRVRR